MNKKNNQNNISINSGTNRYAKTEHEKFKTGILKQLSIIDCRR